jgi:cysteine desulfurase
MVSAFAQYGNPSSVHSFGRAARRIVEDARRQVAALVSGRTDDVIFTSGGTEANNLALRGCGCGRILVSAIEHPSVLEAADDIETVPVDGDGIVDLDALARMLECGGAPAIVSVMLANNETGVVLPVAEAARIAHRKGALIHCDAVQAAGRSRLDMDALGVDMLTLSAHKMGGPKGVGALVVCDRIHLNPIIRGGGQERGRRSGTENLPGIAGFGAAADVAADEVDAAQAAASLRDRLEDRILRDVPWARIVGAGVRRLPNTSCVALPGISAETQIMALDLAGFAVSAGSACSSGKVKASHVLKAMGLPGEIAGCAIRVSLGPTNDESEIDRFVAAYSDFAARTGTSAA